MTTTSDVTTVFLFVSCAVIAAAHFKRLHLNCIQKFPGLLTFIIRIVVYGVWVYRFVADKLGGPIDKGQLANFSWELQLSQLKFDLKSNVVPIGSIKFGIHYHRALLFKVRARVT